MASEQIRCGRDKDNPEPSAGIKDHAAGEDCGSAQLVQEEAAQPALPAQVLCPHAALPGRAWRRWCAGSTRSAGCWRRGLSCLPCSACCWKWRWTAGCYARLWRNWCDLAGTVAAVVQEAAPQQAMPLEGIELEALETAASQRPDERQPHHRGLHAPGHLVRTGRLRHRLLLAAVPAAPAGEHTQDRPQLRCQHAHQRGDLHIVRAVIGLAQASNVSTVAEGVENDEQARALTELGCHELQGYGIAKPMAVEQSTPGSMPAAQPVRDTASSGLGHVVPAKAKGCGAFARQP